MRRSGIDVLGNQICDKGVKETYIGKEMLTGPFNISPPKTFAGSSPCIDLGLELPLAAGLGAGEPDGDGAEDVCAAEAEAAAGDAGPGLGLAVADIGLCLEVEGVAVLD